MQLNLPDFSKSSLLVVGDVMLDRYWLGETARISPEAPVPVVHVKQTDERPGGAANVALNMASLGGKVRLLGLVGEDDLAHTLETQLTAAKVKHQLLRYSNSPTITKLRVISRHQQLLRLDFEEKFPAFDHKLLIDAFKKSLNDVDLIILSDYGKGTLTHVATLIDLAKNANIPVFVDPKGNDFSIYRGCHLITPNLKEFEHIVGYCENEATIVKKARAFLINFDIQALLLTRGDRGMTLIQQNAEELHLPAQAREVFDVTGAGDTVIATLGLAVSAGVSLEVAVNLANIAASLVVAKLGTANVSLPELQTALEDLKHPLSGILNEDQLLQAVTAARLQGKKIVFTNGCFDILHAGHVTYLQQAKQLGDFLIVAVNEDYSIQQIKGPGRPINKVEQRMAVLAGLGVVDWVVSFKELTPKHLLTSLRPDILVKGGDYQIDQVVGADIVQAYGGQVRVLGMIKNVSTTAIIDRVRHQYPSAEAN